MTPAELAAKTKVAERYAREWLSHQAASGYLDYDPASGKFALPPEQAMVFANVDSPVYLQGGFRSRGGDDGEPAQSRGRVSLRQRRRLGRSGAVPVLHRRAFLPSRLPQPSRRVLAAGAGRRRRETRKRRESGRRWLRLRILDHHHGESLPEIDLRRLRLSPRFGGAGADPCRAAWSDREHEVRSRHGERFSRQRPGPGDLLRLPA